MRRIAQTLHRIGHPQDPDVDEVALLKERFYSAAEEGEESGDQRRNAILRHSWLSFLLSDKSEAKDRLK